MTRLDLAQTAHRLRMTTNLVRWLTMNKVNGVKLKSSGNPPTFDADEVEKFDQALGGAWPTRNVPVEITRELEREALGRCGLCDEKCDRLEEAHVRRKGKERNDYCQHPSNLLALCPTCHSRYDAGLVTHAAVTHAKNERQKHLMESIDRDIMTERVAREEIRKVIAGQLGFEDGVSRIIAAATGRVVEPESRLEAVSELLRAVQAIANDKPLTAGLMIGVSQEGLDEHIDAFRYIDSLAQPLPTRGEFDEEFDGHRMMDGHDPSPSLVAWAAHAGAAYECGICSRVCIEPDTLAEALVDYWKTLPKEDDEEDDDQDETSLRNEVSETIVNSGVECGDLFGETSYCSYHAHVMAKDD